MSDDPSTEDGFAALRQRIRSHPGRVAKRSWDAFGQMHAVHLMNDAELLVLIQAMEQNINRMGLTMISNVGPEEPREHLFRELLRRLHNYVASAGTLIDHTRNLTDKYKGTATYDEYRTRLQVAMEDDVLIFVKQLRNYVLHVGVPAIGFEMRIARGERETFLVYINRDDALAYKGWTAPARRFLEDSDALISLRAVIEAYGRVIEGLYKWLYDQFETLHGAEVAEVNLLTAQLLARQPWH